MCSVAKIRGLLEPNDFQCLFLDYHRQMYVQLNNVFLFFFSTQEEKYVFKKKVKFSIENNLHSHVQFCTNADLC